MSLGRTSIKVTEGCAGTSATRRPAEPAQPRSGDVGAAEVDVSGSPYRFDQHPALAVWERQ
jgi:hypothetical protein